MRRSVLAAAFAVAGLRAAAQQPTALPDLLAEADHNNPEILAVQSEWKAATRVRAEVTSLPDPEFTLQEFSVGSPRPGAGLSNNAFAYVGVGASQELPYPGKLRLKGAAADAAAEEERAQIEIVRSRIAEQVKASYLRLAYLQDILSLLQTSRSTLGQIVETQLARYSSGQGSQAEILQAQLDRTKLLREITTNQQETAQVQAELARLLNRSQNRPDIVADELAATQAVPSLAELLRDAERRNPAVAAARRTIAARESQVAATRLAGRPDFTLGYMYQRTGLAFPSYYMATASVLLPRRKRVAAERAEASDRLAAAILLEDSRLQQQTAEARKQYAALTSTEDELKEYRDGILPQAEAVYNSALAALRSNRQTLSVALASLNDTLQLKRDYAQALLEHEVAVVHLEALTGDALR